MSFKYIGQYGNEILLLKTDMPQNRLNLEALNLSLENIYKVHILSLINVKITDLPKGEFLT
jgi:hypothetical protein